MPQVRAISYGGGVQSTALIVLAASGKIDFPLAIMADVGHDSENPDTIEYVQKFIVPYCDTNNIELCFVRKEFRDGSKRTLLEHIRRPSRSIDIPVRMSNGAPGRRNCTENFKIKPVAKEIKRRGATPESKAIIALGISTDEWKRMRTDSGIPHQDLSYPLIELGFSRNDCVNIIKESGLPVPGKSSCYFCPYYTISQRQVQLRDRPDLFEKTAQIEDMLNERRKEIGKDEIFLSSRKKPLRIAIQSVPDRDEDEPSCSIAGYCHA